MLASKFCSFFKVKGPNAIYSRFLTGAANSLLENLKNYEATGLPKQPQNEEAHDFDLTRMRQLLSIMGDPQNELKAVQIAGTKGKGSVANILANILHQSSYKTGLYTSPHINDLRERICIDSKIISEENFDGLAETWAPKIFSLQQDIGGRLSHFEVLTALAFRHFANSQVDVAVVETGVGGILDATNVFNDSQHLMAIITALGLEHRELLGDTIEEIAKAKAGICKARKPCVIGRQKTEDIQRMLEDTVHSYEAVPHFAHNITTVDSGPIHLEDSPITQSFNLSLRFSSDNSDSQEVRSRLIGDHQAENTETAIASALLLEREGWAKITPESIMKGVTEVQLPGRFQIEQLSSGTRIALDGSHTPESAETVAKTLEQVFPTKPIALIIAMADDKDHAGVMIALRKIRPKIVVFTSVNIAGDSTRSAPPGMLTGFWQEANFHDEQAFRCRELLQANMSSAIQMCERELSALPEEGIICVTGSLHAVGEALKIVHKS